MNRYDEGFEHGYEEGRADASLALFAGIFIGAAGVLSVGGLVWLAGHWC